MSAGEKSVYLIDCMSVGEQHLHRCHTDEGHCNINGYAVVLFNVDKNWDFPPKACAHKFQGVFFQDDSKSEFIKGMRGILNGHRWSPPRQKPQPPAPDPRCTQSPEQQLASLSPRERELLQLLSVGLSNTEIAADLSISLNTVKTHIYNIYKKIGVSNRLQAAIWSTALCLPRRSSPPAGAGFRDVVP